MDYSSKGKRIRLAPTSSREPSVAPTTMPNPKSMQNEVAEMASQTSEAGSFKTAKLQMHKMVIEMENKCKDLNKLGYECLFIAVHKTEEDNIQMGTEEALVIADEQHFLLSLCTAIKPSPDTPVEKPSDKCTFGESPDWSHDTTTDMVSLEIKIEQDDCDGMNDMSDCGIAYQPTVKIESPDVSHHSTDSIARKKIKIEEDDVPMEGMVYHTLEAGEERDEAQNSAISSGDGAQYPADSIMGPSCSDVSLDPEMELENMIKGEDSRNTKDVIRNAVNVLRHYCEVKQTTLTEVEAKAPEELCKFLRTFYLEVRQTSGKLYAKRSMISLRYGLSRHFQTIMSIDIINNGVFKPANMMFRASLHKLKAKGIGMTKHKHPITKEDMIKIKNSSAVDVSTPRGLQNKVFMDVMQQFCSRGQRNLREMKPSDFGIAADSTNQRFVYLKKDKLSKNHKGELDEDDESLKCRMYETGLDDCPVKSFYDYISRLNPLCECLWQRPRAKIQPEHMCWYDNAPIGKNTLGQMMARISTEANCSKRYTNHCLRATTNAHLDEAGCECGARRIMATSGHKLETSLEHNSKMTEACQQQVSSTISEQGQSTSGSEDEGWI